MVRLQMASAGPGPINGVFCSHAKAFFVLHGDGTLSSPHHFHPCALRIYGFSKRNQLPNAGTSANAMGKSINFRPLILAFLLSVIVFCGY
jgi:hypothetical protein